MLLSTKMTNMHGDFLKKFIHMIYYSTTINIIVNAITVNFVKKVVIVHCGKLQ